MRETNDGLTCGLVALNSIMALAHSSLAYATVALGNTALRVPVYHSLLDVQINYASGGVGSGDVRGWALVPGSESDVVFHLPLTLACAAFFVISGAFHAGNVLVWRESYLRGVRDARCLSRWIEYSLSAPIMAAALIGYTTSSVLFLNLVAIFGLTATTMFFGHLQEVVARPGPGDTWRPSRAVERYMPHALGWVPQGFAWFLILYQFARGFGARGVDSRTGEERGAPSFVLYIVYGEALLFWSFGLVQIAVLCRPPSKYWQGEVAYQVLSLASKAVLGGAMLANVLMLGSFAEAFERQRP